MLQIWFLDYFSKSVSSKSELESSLRSFSASDSIFNLTGSGEKKEKMVRGVGGERLFEGGDQSMGGYYSRKYAMCVVEASLRGQV